MPQELHQSLRHRLISSTTDSLGMDRARGVHPMVRAQPEHYISDNRTSRAESTCHTKTSAINAGQRRRQVRESVLFSIELFCNQLDNNQMTIRRSKSMVETLIARANTHKRSWVPRLGTIFAEQGLLASCSHRYPTSPHAGFFLTQAQLVVCEEYSWVTLDNSGPEARGPQRRMLIQEAAREMQEGVGMKFIIEVTTGRKAW